MSNIDNKGSIIVIDDDKSVREIVARVLRDEGYEVVTAGNGREALERTARRSFDLVFLDIKMPGLHGLDVLTLLTAGRPHTPVVILTGQVDSDTEEEALQRGAFAYLTKPCRVNEIADIANNLINSKQSSAEEGLNLANQDQQDAQATTFQEQLAIELQPPIRAKDLPKYGTIMIVDDDDSVRDVIARALLGAGYEVHTATTGSEALEKADRQHFDLMFLDIRMPDISEFEVLATMEANHPTTIVVILTAVSNTTSQMEACQREAFTCMTKPCDLNEVVATADRIIGATR